MSKLVLGGILLGGALAATQRKSPPDGPVTIKKISKAETSWGGVGVGTRRAPAVYGVYRQGKRIATLMAMTSAFGVGYREKVQGWEAQGPPPRYRTVVTSYGGFNKLKAWVIENLNEQDSELKLYPVIA